MNWKQDLQLSDLDDGGNLEVSCRRCGHTRYETIATLKSRQDVHRHIYLDELETRLKCTQRGCHGAVRLSIVVDAETEGFMGGLA